MDIQYRGFEKVSLERWLEDYNTFDSFMLYNKIKLPQRATNTSAGYDIFCPFDFELSAHESIKIPTGIKAYMCADEFLMIVPRSSMGFKYFMRLANTLAIGDSDYYNNVGNEGHYWIKIRNEGKEKMIIKKGDAIAQGIFQHYLLVDGDNAFQGTDRIGGIGSTG